MDWINMVFKMIKTIDHWNLEIISESRFERLIGIENNSHNITSHRSDHKAKELNNHPLHSSPRAEPQVKISLALNVPLEGMRDELLQSPAAPESVSPASKLS